MMNKTNVLAFIGLVCILGIISVIIPFFTSLRPLESMRIVFGSVYVLFLPGFIMSYIFFPKKKHEHFETDKNSIDFIERIALSFALSIAVVPLAVFYLNLIGVKINLLNSFLTILGIIIISLLIIGFKMRRF